MLYLEGRSTLKTPWNDRYIHVRTRSGGVNQRSHCSRDRGHSLFPWTCAFDVDIFIDDDKKPYLYFPGRSTDGIYVAPLDPKDLTWFAAAPKHLFGCQPAHRWERWGESNKYLTEAWIEGPRIFKRNGIYHLEYSGSGRQLVAVPYDRSRQSSRRAAARHERHRIRRERQHVCAYQRNAAAGPGAVTDPAERRFRSRAAHHQQASEPESARPCSSKRPGHDAAYALDNSNGTWLEAEDDAQPSLTIDLGSTTEFAAEQLFTVDPVYCGPQPHRIHRRRSAPRSKPRAPHVSSAPLGITEFTVFGKAVQTPKTVSPPLS